MKLRDSLATDIKPGYAFMLNREKQAFWVQDFVVKAHDQGPQEQDEWVLLGSHRRGIRCQVGRVGSASARDASEVEWTTQTEISDIDEELFVESYCPVVVLAPQQLELAHLFRLAPGSYLVAARGGSPVPER